MTEQTLSRDQELEQVRQEWNKEKEQFLKKEENQKNEQIVLMNKFSPKLYADKLLSETSFIFDRYGHFFRYDRKEGIWKGDAEMYIKKQLRSRLMGEEQQKKQYTEEIVSYIRELSYDPEFIPEQSKDIIAFNNCVYDLREEKVKSLSPDFFITKKIPVNYSENNTFAPYIDDFFDKIYGDKKQTLYDLCAYCLYPGQPYQKFFLLYGAGGNGKSAFMNFLTKFLGETNTSSISIHDVQNDKFSTASMLHTYANICGDIKYKEMREVDTIKKLTGEDPIPIREMRKAPYKAYLNTKQIFSTNKPPIIHDDTYATWRRVYLLEFNKTIKESEDLDMQTLLSNLTSPEELEGFAFKCIEALKEMKNRGFKFTHDVDVEQIRKRYQEISNPISNFLSHYVEESFDAYVWKHEFKERLQSYLKSNGFKQASDVEIAQEMKKRGIEVVRKPAPAQNKKVWRAWSGIRIKEVPSINYDSDSTDRDDKNDRGNNNKPIIYGEDNKTPDNPDKVVSKKEERKNSENLEYQKIPSSHDLSKSDGGRK